MAEREQRYTQAQRQAIRERNQAAAAGAKYGASYASQGYRPEKEAGKAFLSKQEQRAAHGAFAPTSWLTQYDSAGNLIGVKPMAKQTGRIEEIRRMGLDPTQWLDPSKVLSPGQWAAIQRTTIGPQGQARRAYLEANPELASQPGGGMDAWRFHQYTSRLPVDPTTGLRMNPQGELYDPSRFGQAGYRGGAVGQAGVGVEGMDPSQYRFTQPYAQPAFPSMTPAYFGGYGQPGGYIPGYSVPGQQQNPFASYGYQPRPQTTAPNYRTLQQQGGSSFGTYQPWGG